MLIISPAYATNCTFLGISTAYCYDETEKATLIIKSNNFYIFVSQTLEINNMIFDGRDLGEINGADYSDLGADVNTVDLDGLAQ